MGVLDVFDAFNWQDRLQGFVWTLLSFLPHKRSHKGRKVGPYVVDGGVREIHIDRCNTSGREAEDILKAAHIPIAGRRITSKEAIFLVKARQAAWAELLLLRAGVKLGPKHTMIDPKNVGYAAGKGAVPMWGQASAASPVKDAKGAQGVKGVPAGQLGRTARKLDGFFTAQEDRK